MHEEKSASLDIIMKGEMNSCMEEARGPKQEDSKDMSLIQSNLIRLSNYK